MISVNFINGLHLNSYVDSDYLNMKEILTKESEFVENMIDDVLYNYDKAVLEYTITESGHRPELILESDGKNIFARIGDAIIGMFKKINELVGKFLNFLSGKNTEIQSESERLDALLKEVHSDEIRKDIVYHVNKGDLNLTNAKNVQDVRKAYDELMAMSAQDNATTFKGKVKNFLHRTKPNDDYEKQHGGKFLVAISAATAVVGLAKGGLELYKTIKEVKTGLSKSSKETQKALEDARVTKAKAEAREAEAKATLAENKVKNYKDRSEKRKDIEQQPPRYKNAQNDQSKTGEEEGKK